MSNRRPSGWTLRIRHSDFGLSSSSLQRRDRKGRKGGTAAIPGFVQLALVLGSPCEHQIAHSRGGVALDDAQGRNAHEQCARAVEGVKMSRKRACEDNG